jgi:glutamyl-tRNA synthetase
MKELTELFHSGAGYSSPARFDMKKLEAINGDKIRALSADEFFHWAMPFLLKSGTATESATDVELVKKALPIIQERITTLSEIPALLNFLFATEFAIEAESAAKITDDASRQVLAIAADRLSALTEWNHVAIEEVLRKSTY